MKIDIVSLFPAMFDSPFGDSIIKRAIDKRLLTINITNPREFTYDRHNTVDDYPFGGGSGMLLKPEPFFRAVNSIIMDRPQLKRRVILMCPSGAVFSQDKAKELAAYEQLIFICGHYEGFDARIGDYLADESLSIGDYVLTGGELPAMVVIDAVARMLPGVLGAADSASTDSFYDGLLQYPQYTRPRDFNGLCVPEVLLSGNHANIAVWRREQSLYRTCLTRPDLLAKATLTKQDETLAAKIQKALTTNANGNGRKSTMQFKFTKWQGAGNDFVIAHDFGYADYPALAVAVCDRHYGIGADGLVIIYKSTAADFQMRIFNNDGSEAEMCGNVSRCVAKFLYEEKMIMGVSLTLETKAGVIKPFINVNDGTVTVNMGQPILEPALIPTSLGSDKAVDEKLTVNGVDYRVTCVSMGNPHCILFVDDVENTDIETIGAAIETCAAFPRKTNVEFIEIIDRHTMRMRVWERGVGVTLACGTGASASLTAAVLNDKTDRAADIILDGGKLNIRWDDDGCIYMTGDAVKVFEGVYTIV